MKNNFYKTWKRIFKKINISYIFVVFTLIIIGVIAFSVKIAYDKAISNILTPDELIDSFNKNISNENFVKMKEILISKNKDYNLEDEDVKRIIHLLNEDSDYKNYVINKLKNNINSNKKDNLFSLIKTENSVFGKSEYKIGVDTIKVEINTPDFIKSTIENEHNSNFYFPGIYRQKFISDGIEFNTEVKIYDKDKNFKDNVQKIKYDDLQEEDILSDYEINRGNRYISIRTFDYTNSYVIIDGLFTSMNVITFNNINPKDLHDGQSIQIIKFSDKKILKSKVKKINEGDEYIDLVLDFWSIW